MSRVRVPSPAFVINIAETTTYVTCRLHKARNYAVVTINGKNHYLGPYGSPESHQKYAALIDTWRATQGLCADHQASALTSGTLTIAELIAAYWSFAKGYYVKDGAPTGQLHVVNSALRYVWNGYHTTLAKDFGPLTLQSLQERMIADSLCRTYINGHTRRIKLMFKWAVSKELLPAVVHVALSTVNGLEKGRSQAREGKVVRPVAAKTVEATLPFLPNVVADMVRFQQRRLAVSGLLRRILHAEHRIKRRANRFSRLGRTGCGASFRPFL